MQTGTAAKGREPAHSEKARILPFIIIIVTSFCLSNCDSYEYCCFVSPKATQPEAPRTFYCTKMCEKSKSTTLLYYETRHPTMKQGNRRAFITQHNVTTQCCPPYVNMRGGDNRHIYLLFSCTESHAGCVCGNPPFANMSTTTWTCLILNRIESVFYSQ